MNELGASTRGRANHSLYLAKIVLAAWRSESRPLATASVVAFDDLPTAAPPFVVDVRDPVEFADAHLPGALAMHVSRLRSEARALPGEPDEPLWLYCATGYRASVAAGLVERSGRVPVIVLDSFDDNGRRLIALAAAQAS